MFTADGNQSIYDEGFNNTAVTPTQDDLGRGGTAPFPRFTNPRTGQAFPLAFSSLAILQVQGLLPFQTPILDPFLPVDIPVNKNGLFKAPGLRNVELTAPYFHNGTYMTLEEVMDFYARGGNFVANNLADADPLIGSGIPLIRGREDLHAALIAFLKSLTDPRVRLESAPFDHPELFIPEGDPEVPRRICAKDLNGICAPEGNTAPIITSTCSTTALATLSYTCDVNASDTPGDPLTFSLIFAPAGMTIDPTTGVISWTPTEAQTGPHEVNIRATDSGGLFANQGFTLNVEVPHPPSITSTCGVAATAGQPYTCDVNATDPNNDTLTYTLTASPTGMTIDPGTGVISWTPTGAQTGPNNVTVAVSDGVFPAVTQSFTITVSTSAIVVSPTSLDMGQVNVGSDKARTVTVSNTGTSSLAIGRIILTPANDFAIKSDLCSNGSLPAGASCTIKAKFDPLTAGAQSATLSIPSDDPDTPTVSVSLSGAGTLTPVFADVPEGSFAENFINSCFYEGITGGCGGGNFCPDASITRGQMAVFLETSQGHAAGPCTGAKFTDVNSTVMSAAMCGFIENMFDGGITGGCGGGNFCPNDPVTRAQMAVFIETALGNPPNTCTGVFTDVPAGSFACGFIERLTADGITGGCGGGNFCPNDPVSRAQMAVFLVAAPAPLMP